MFRYLCELSGEVMTQPVKANCDGRVYDRTTIESFRLSSGKLCPPPPDLGDVVSGGRVLDSDDPTLVPQPELEAELQMWTCRRLLLAKGRLM